VGPQRNVPNKGIAEEEVRLRRHQTAVELAVFNPMQILAKEPFVSKPFSPSQPHPMWRMSLRRRESGPISNGE
jgi:hypothetical protein